MVAFSSRLKQATSICSQHTKKFSTKSSPILQILPEVSEALANNKPVVALESTILAHGLPYPENIELAKELSEIIRGKGAIPCTIAVKNNKCRVGLTQEELQDLAISGVEKRAAKCSTKDLPLFLGKQNILQQQNYKGPAQWGATTVASTMHLAHLANISTFVTGGTGGVHRGGEDTMDVSADLLELARTPVVVVSAGVKSILDISRTLEVLETNGVPAAAFQADEFPAFFSPSSGIRAPARVDSAEEVAMAYLSSLDLGLKNGMLIGVPNNHPAGASVEDAIQEVLKEADELNISGRDVTPFILKRVSEKTKGDSLKSNTALVKGNANVGADIAVAITKARSGRENDKNIFPSAEIKQRDVSNITNSKSESDNSAIQSRVIVMGGAVIDLVAKPKTGSSLILGTSNPGICKECDGGVGRNIAEVLSRLGIQPALLSAVGSDTRGSSLVQRLTNELGIMTRIDVVEDSNTATYLALLDSNGDLHTAIADMDVLQRIRIPSEEDLSGADYLVVDANAPISSLIEAAQNARWAAVEVCFEPTSVPKAIEVSKNKQFMSALTYAFPNLDELYAMAGSERSDNEGDIKVAAKTVLNTMNFSKSHLVITMGSKGAMLASKYENKPISYKMFDVSPIENVANCTGAGDTLTGGFIYGLLNGKSEEEALKIGMEKALISLQCEESTISPYL